MEQIWGPSMGLRMGWKIPSDHALLFSFFSRETVWNDRWVSPHRLKTSGSSCVSCGMRCSSHQALFLLFLCKLNAANLSNSQSVHRRNFGSPHRISCEMIIWRFSPSICYLFILQRNKLQNWVSAASHFLKRGSGLPVWAVGWGFLFIMCWFSLPFPEKHLINTGESPLPY